jgi:serine protease inhibitor
VLELEMPQFLVNESRDILQALAALGLDCLMDSAVCDLSYLSPQPDLYVALFKHQAYVAVNEVGTEAGVVIVKAWSLSQPVYENFGSELDEPFFFVIGCTKTHEPVITGRVVAPAFED